MKTRIVYPQMWEDTKFSACALETKVLFCYLTNNLYLGLTRYSHINDRRILFDTALTSKQLETGKKELSELNWVLFFNDWQYHNHNCAYVDYTGRDRVQEAKEKELDSIPLKVKEHFNGLIRGYEPVNHSGKVKGLITGYKPVLNHKSKTINHKSKTNTDDFEVVDTNSIREVLRAKGLKV